MVFRSMRDPILNYLTQLMVFGNDIMAVIKPEEVEKVLKVLNAVGEISAGVDKAMKDLQKKMSRDQMAKLGWLMTHGIFGAIIDFFPTNSDMKYALNIMTTTVGVLMEMVKMIDTMETISNKLKGNKMDVNIGTNMRNMIFEASYVKASLEAAEKAGSLTKNHADRMSLLTKEMAKNIYLRGGVEVAEDTSKTAKDTSGKVSADISEADTASTGPGGWMETLFGWITGKSSAIAARAQAAEAEAASADKARLAAMNRNNDNPGGPNRANMPNRAMGGSFWVGEAGVPELISIKPMGATSVTSPQPIGRATTASSVSTLERVQREKASLDAGTKGQQNTDVGKLEDLNEDQVSILRNINAGISALVSSMERKSNRSAGGQTGSYISPLPTIGMTSSPFWGTSQLSEHPTTGLPKS